MRNDRYSKNISRILKSGNDDISFLESLGDYFTGIKESINKKQIFRKKIVSSKILDDKRIKKIHLNTHKKQIRIALLADTHFGNPYFNEKYINRAYERFYLRETDFILHGGDITDGIRKYIESKSASDIACDALIQKFVETYPFLGNKTVLVGGNHDHPQYNLGHDIMSEILQRRNDIIFAGYNCVDIVINGLTIRMVHDGKGLFRNNYDSIKQYSQKLLPPEKPDIIVKSHSHRYSDCFSVEDINIVRIPAFIKDEHYKDLDRYEIGIWWIDIENFGYEHKFDIYFESLEEPDFCLEEDYQSKHEIYEEYQELYLSNRDRRITRQI